MLAIAFLGIAGFILYRFLGGAPVLRLQRQQSNQAAEDKISDLTDYASRLRGTNKYVGAEKVYLQILKIDHKHAATYSRLGTLYAKMRNHDDAIECFRIATQLTPSGSTYYNLGLAYYERQNFIKAIAAFEKAIMFEPSQQRYVGLAKAYQKTGDVASMISALEQAIDSEPSAKTLWMLAEAYQAVGRDQEIERVYEKIHKIDPKNQRLRAVRRLARSVRRTAPLS